MNYIVIKLFCLLLSFDSVYPAIGEKAYVETVSAETMINSLEIEEHTITACYCTDEEFAKAPYLNATIRFPQISNMEDKSIQKKINREIKDAVMQSLNRSGTVQTLWEFHEIVNDQARVFWYGENEYRILSAGDESIGINFEGTRYDWGEYQQFSDYFTISLINGEKIPFTAYFSKEDVIHAIESLEYDWIKGKYRRRYKDGYERYELKEVEKLASTVKQMKETPDPYGGYTESIYNFAMDEQYAYINMYFYNIIPRGHAVLKFDLDTLR